MMNPKTWKRFAMDHAWGLLVLLLLGGYSRMAERFSFPASECLLHRFLRVYCPLCGGTRAVTVLFRLNFAEALRCNALVVLMMLAALIVYIFAWVRLLRGKENPWQLPRGVWIVALSVLLLFGIARNLLMIVWGIDPLGDLLPFWNGK